MIQRIIKKQIENDLFGGKAIIVLGPRQVGKTTLIHSILADKPHLFLNADDEDVVRLLSGASTLSLKRIIGQHKIIYVDEAQRIPGCGLTFKIITDQFKHVQLIATGSSALELNQEIKESLTGRKWDYHLYPISWQELEDDVNYLKSEQHLEHRLIYGMYPAVIENPGRENEILKELTNSYLYKDILALAGIRKPELLNKLVQALALQVGSEVSYNELAQLLQVDKATVSNYIDLLEKAFIVFTLTSLSRNLRNEVKRNRKIYFWDNGIRNMIISNLNSLHLRLDKGALWENFLISERQKLQAYNRTIYKPYFWRTTAQQEVDYIEDSGGKISAYELKWQDNKRVRWPANFVEAYNPEINLISRDNFRNFIGTQ